MDKIQLKKMQFYGYHGLLPEENKLGQRFLVNATLFLPLQKAGETDDMKHSIDYGEVYKFIRKIVEGERNYLIEAVAERIAAKLFREFPSLKACQIEVVKPDPPIHGSYESVSVEIYRERKE